MGKVKNKKHEKKRTIIGKAGSDPPVFKSPCFFITFIIFAALLLSFAAYKRNGIWKDGLQLWKDVVRKSVGKDRSRSNLGLAYYNQGRLDEAVKEYLAALRLKPDLPEVHNNIGNTHTKQGRLDEAIEEYTAALRFNPDYADAHYNLGLAYWKKGLKYEAREEFEMALRLKPDFIPAHQAIESLGNRGPQTIR